MIIQIFIIILILISAYLQHNYIKLFTIENKIIFLIISIILILIIMKIENNRKKKTSNENNNLEGFKNFENIENFYCPSYN